MLEREVKGRVVWAKEKLGLIVRDLEDVFYAIRKVTIRGSVLKEEGDKNSKAKVEGKHP